MSRRKKRDLRYELALVLWLCSTPVGAKYTRPNGDIWEHTEAGYKITLAQELKMVTVTGHITVNES